MTAAHSRPTSVFITYNGLLDPLGTTQGLRYVESLARDRPIHIVSFERPERLRSADALSTMRARVASGGIGWTMLTYHKRPRILAKAWDVLRGASSIRTLVRGGKVGLLHARGHVPMDMAMRGGGRTPILFDIRGLLGEEYIDAGIWTARDVGYRLLKRSESAAFRRADAAVVLTHAVLPYVRDRFASVGREVPIRVIPTCVDTALFRRDEGARSRVRAEIGADASTIVFAYSGSLGNWYMANEMASFVRQARERTGRPVRLLWQVNNAPEIARAASRSAGLDMGEWTVARGRPEDVVERLSAADVGLALIRPSFSHIATAPTKYAEYLALGLPVVLSAGVGDSEDLVRRRVAVSVASPADDTALSSALEALRSILVEPPDHFRGVALELFDVERVATPAYRALYDLVAERRP